MGQNCAILRNTDSLQLLNLYNNLAQKGKIDFWDFSKPLDQIDPLRIKIEDGCRITYLSLENDNIAYKNGLFPTEVLALDGLKYLKLSSSNPAYKIKDNIPSDLYNKLIRLEHLDLSYNQLSGNISVEISKLTSLRYLNFAENNLTGSIPESIFELINLNDLVLRKNKLSGGLSKSINKLKFLQHLRIGDNLLSGEIPVELADCLNLQTLSIQNNFFEKTIPSSVANLTFLRNVLLNNNLFNDLPLFSSNFLSELNISGNHLTIEDILPISRNIDRTRTGIFVYQPQDTITELKYVQLNPGQKHLLTTSIDQSINSNEYGWLRNGEFITSGREDSIRSYNNLIDIGTYHCQISNAELPGLRIIIQDDVLSGKTQINYYNKNLCYNKTETHHNIIFDKSHTQDTVFLKAGALQKCDSIIYFNYKIIDISKYDIYVNICPNQNYHFENNIYQFPGTYKVKELRNYLGCDSTIYLHISRNPEMSSNVQISKNMQDPMFFDVDPDISIAYPISYLWNTGSVNKVLEKVPAGTYSVVVTDINNCSKKFVYDVRNVTAIDDQTQFHIKLNPNPSSLGTDLTIKVEESLVRDHIRYNLISSDGKIILRNQIIPLDQKSFILNTDNLQPGSYRLIFYNINTLQNFSINFLIL